MESAQHAPSDEIAPRECGWKHGDSGYSAGENFVSENPRTRYEPRIPLTPTGLLMEGDYTHHRQLLIPSTTASRSSTLRLAAESPSRPAFFLQHTRGRQRDRNLRHSDRSGCEVVAEFV